MSNNILWLASWYPNTLSPFDGDFIQRHARAVAAIENIMVLYIKKDEKKIITTDIKKIITKTNNLTEIIIYYHSLTTGIKLLDKLLSRKKYNSIYRRTLKKIIKENGIPDLVHVHVALNVIRQARWLNKKYSLPIVISEHWTGYLPEAKPNLNNYHPVYKRWLQKIFNEAAAVTVVSKVLGDAIQNRFKINYQVIPNVVDTNIFYPAQKQVTSITKFIHVSLLNYQKNPQAIIEAFHLVKKSGYNFRLVIYGPDNIDLKQLVNEKDLQTEIIFKKEVPQIILAKEMQQSDALILFSRYETFGCVIIEANACGIPAIVSDLPVFREYLKENITGIFAEPNDPSSLAEKIIFFINNRSTFSSTEIANYTRNIFSYDAVAPQFVAVYKNILEK
jgi:glycosyltransferase involved in cell wall biosynthesis